MVYSPKGMSFGLRCRRCQESDMWAITPEAKEYLNALAAAGRVIWQGRKVEIED